MLYGSLKMIRKARYLYLSFGMSKIRFKATLCFSSKRDTFKLPYVTYVRCTLLKVDVFMARLRSRFTLYVHDLRVKMLFIFYIIHVYVPSFLCFTHQVVLMSKVKFVFGFRVYIVLMYQCLCFNCGMFRVWRRIMRKEVEGKLFINLYGQKGPRNIFCSFSVCCAL